jgi:outer membrane protein assembly factor BamB
MQRWRIAFGVVLLTGSFISAQVGRGGSEWLTALGDAQRTSWIRTDAKISLESMSKPGFELQWTSKLDNQARQLNGLSQGVTANGVTLFVPMSVVTGSSNNVYAIDNDTGYVVWQRHFDATMPPPTAACPGGITSAATRIVSVMPRPITAPPAGPGGGRGGAGYQSLLGEPGEGVPVQTRGGGPGRAAGAPPPGAPPPAGAGAAAPPARGVGAGGAPPAGPPPAAAQPQGPGRGGQAAPPIPGAGGVGGGGGFGRPSGVVYVVTSDGMLHVLGLQSGKDIQKPAPFLPANAHWSDPIAVNTTLYAATSGNCGGTPNGVWAIDLDSEAKPVVSWKTDGGSVVGAIAFTTDGTLVAAIGPGKTTGDGKANAIVTLDPKTLQVKDWFTQPTAEFVTGPMIFRHNDKDLVAAATRDGRIVLLDATSLGGANHSTPLYSSRSFLGAGATVAGEALSTWQQATIADAPAPTAGAPAAPPTVTLGTRWILAPVTGRFATGVPATNGAISTGAVLALKLVDAGGALSLEPGWVSHNIAVPATPIIVNGVVFALSTGQPAAASGQGSAAMLRAYDGATGKALWSSGKSMTSFAVPGSFWSAMAQIYIGTRDGTLYAFGFLDERR